MANYYNNISSIWNRIGDGDPSNRTSNLEVAVDRNLVEFDTALDIYDEWMQLENFTPKTIKENLKRVKYFFNWCVNCGVPNLSSVTRETISQYILYYKNERKAKAQTINKCVNCIRGMFRQCIERGFNVHNDAMQVMKKMKEDKPIIIPFNRLDIELILKYPNKNTYTGYRMYFLFMLALDTGLRIQEILNLKYEDISMSGRMLIVQHAKSRVARTVPFSITLYEEFQIYEKIKNEVGINSPYVFVDFNCQQMSYEAVKCYIQRMNNHITLNSNGKIHMHRFRHTFCYYFIKNGGNPFALQKIAGHASLNTTLQYVNLANDTLSESHDKFSFFAINN